MKNIFEAGKAHLDLMGQTDNPAVHTIAANEFRISVVLFRQTRWSTAICRFKFCIYQSTTENGDFLSMEISSYFKGKQQEIIQNIILSS